MQTLDTAKPNRKKVKKTATIQQRVTRIKMLDFGNVKRKLMMKDHGGLNWTNEQADEAEKWYKRFLEIILRFPRRIKFVPNGPIDAFWHQHILDTQSYTKDCHWIFGTMLHHNPYFGVKDEKDRQDNQRAFDETNAIYREVFGEDCTSMKYFSRSSDGKDDRNCDTSITCNGQ